MFDELPATKPVGIAKRKRALITSVLFHVALVFLLLLIPLFGPGNLSGIQLLTTAYMATPPPPPAPPSPSAVESATPQRERVRNEVSPEVPRVEQPHPIEQPVDKPDLISPVEVPKDLAKIIDAAPRQGSGGVIGGVPGGVPGGIPSGVLGGKLGGVPGGVDNTP